MASQIETPVFTSRTTTHHFIGQQQHSAAHWEDHQWNAEWLDNPTRLHIFIPDTYPGVTIPRGAWVRRLSRLRTGVGHFCS